MFNLLGIVRVSISIRDMRNKLLTKKHLMIMSKILSELKIKFVLWLIKINKTPDNISINEYLKGTLKLQVLHLFLKKSCEIIGIFSSQFNDVLQLSQKLFGDKIDWFLGILKRAKFIKLPIQAPKTNSKKLSIKIIVLTIISFIQNFLFQFWSNIDGGKSRVHFYHNKWH